MRTIPPLVTTKWLAENMAEPGLVVIDIRNSDEYKDGHIPGAVNAPFSSWAKARGGLLLELPEADELFDTIGAAGIKSDSRVVVVNKTDTPFTLADAARVACTLIYGGVKNVAVLNGGYNKWLKERRPVSNKTVKSKKVAYKGKLNEEMFVTKAYVEKKLGKSVIVDARTPDEFFGIAQDLFTEKAGHIPTATCLPAPWLWTDKGTYRSIKEIRAMVTGVVGRDKSKEIILYCGVGGFAGAWCFVLREILGYINARVYDGAAQEWTADPEAPIARYRWD
ncbi:Thiosulfate sulfurtransferase [subsurface metagenome]